MAREHRAIAAGGEELGRAALAVHRAQPERRDHLHFASHDAQVIGRARRVLRLRDGVTAAERRQEAA
jgi:hypothetical protein